MQRVGAAAPSMKAPLLMVTSDADQICDPEAARALVERYGGCTEQLRYEELYHEVLNEPEKDVVLAGILAWLLSDEEDVTA